MQYKKVKYIKLLVYYTQVVFVENEDFFHIAYRNLKSMGVTSSKSKGGRLFTERGYLKLVKTFGDDLARKVDKTLQGLCLTHRKGGARNRSKIKD